MLKLIEKIEQLFNSLFAKIIAAVISLLENILPRRIFYKIDDFKYQASYKWARFKEDSHKKSKEAIANAKVKKDEFFKTLQQMQDYPLSEKINAKIQNLKNFILTTGPKGYWKLFQSFFISTVNLFKRIAERFSPTMLKLTAIAIIIIFVASSAIYNQGRFIWLEENPTRAPAKVNDHMDKPPYYNRGAKVMIIRNLKIPVISKNVTDIRSITVELSVRTSTRFAKLFLEEKEHVVRDQLFVNLEPILSSFPIKEEGKRVLAEKVQSVLNDLLKSEHIEGKVEMVRFLYISAT